MSLKIHPEFQNDSQAMINIAFVYANKGDRENARKFFEKAIELKPDSAAYYLAYGGYLLESLLKERQKKFALSSDDINELKRIDDLLSQSITILTPTERFHELTSAYLNRSSARAVLDRHEEALKDINKAIELTPDSAMAFINRAKIKRLLKDIDGSTEDFLIGLDKGANKDEIIPLLITVYLERKKPDVDKALEVLRKYYSPQEIAESNMYAAIGFADCKIIQRDFKEAESIVRRLYNAFGENPRIVLLEAELKKAQGDIASFERLSILANEKQSPMEATIAKLQLAQLYKNQGLYDKAIPIYQELVTENLFDDLLRDYLICLYKSEVNRKENVKKCLEICTKFKAQGKNITFLMELEASIYREMDKLQEASSVYEELIKLEPENLKHKLYSAACLLEINRNDAKAQELINQIIDEVSDKDNLVMLAKILVTLQRFNEAIEKCYLALDQDFNNLNTQLTYVHIFLARGDKKDPFLDSETAKEKFFVKIKKNGREDEYLITNDPKASISKRELFKDSGLGKLLYGKKVGEKVATPQKEEIEVLEIKSIYVKAFQEVMDNINTNFPDDKTIQRMEFDPESIKKNIKNLGERQAQILEMYLSKQITIGVMSNLINRNIFVTWGGLVSQVKPRLHFANGSLQEQTQEQQLIDASNEILIEPIALMTLAHLKIIDLPSKLFKKVYIPRSIMDVIDSEILEERGHKSQGYSVMSFRNGQFFYEDVTGEQVLKRINFLEKIKTEINKCMEVVGLDSVFDKDMEERVSVFGREYVYVQDIAQNKNLPIFCDDSLFKELIAHEYGLKAFNVQNFLVACLKKKLISEIEYCDKVIELGHLGYFYLSVSAPMLFRAIEKNNFLLSKLGDFGALIRSLEAKETTKESLINVLSDFIKLIYIEKLPHDIKTAFLDISLGLIMQKDGTETDMKVFLRVIEKKLGVASVLMPQIQQDAFSWLKAERHSAGKIIRLDL